MKIIQQINIKVVLRSYAYDNMVGHFDNKLVKKCILHIQDRNIGIECMQ
ncbi:MAG: Uncharacterised protein [Cryomorphaceae bacterium]|jgi:hypothetical protein|nr:MAG: Uncharacterised protein [Cryomorphaceae bacterium]